VVQEISAAGGKAAGFVADVTKRAKSDAVVQTAVDRGRPVPHNLSTSGFPLLLLRGRRQHTVQAQIHCGFGVVVRPSTG
jgi:hypothetical protein